MRYAARRACPFTLAALAAVLGLVACGDDPAGPAPSAEIAIAVIDLDGPAITEEPGTAPRIRCDVTFRATATGNGSAGWQDATVKFFLGPNRGAPVDSIFVPATEIREAWGDAALAAGTTAESRWFFTSGAPFAVAADFRYMPSSSGTAVATSSVRFTCGPEVPANSAVPVITGPTLTAPADGLEPSDTLLVSYTATSALGMWTTAVEVIGPCAVFTQFSERLQTTVTRTVPVVIPRGCTLGPPLVVNVYATDAALQGVSRGVTGPAVVDHTPPTVTARVIPLQGSTSPIHFAGDSIRLDLTAVDNNALRTIVYELLPTGRRDSVAVATNFNGVFRVPLPSDVTGPVQVRLFARDVAGLTSPEVVTPASAIQVYPTVERPTLQTTFDGGVRDMVIDAARGAIYVVPWNRQRITVLSSASLDVTRLIELPYTPTSLDVTPGGDSLIVTTAAGLRVIDLRSPTPVLSEIPLTLDAALAQRPERVVVLANGKAYVALGGNSAPAAKLLEVDLATGEQRTRTDAADATGVAIAMTIQRSPDRTAFVFNGGPGHFRRYDAATNQFTLGGTAVPSGVMLSLDRGGQHSALSLDIYDATLGFVRRVESIFGSAPVAAASSLSADGEYLYHLGGPGIMRSRVSDGLLVDRTRNPIAGEMIRIASDDSFLVTAFGFSTAVVSLIRLR